MPLYGTDYNTNNPECKTPQVLYTFNNGAKYILKRWWIFAIAGLLGGIAGLIYQSTQKVEYKSHLVFALDDEGGNGNSLSLMNLASQFGFSPGGSNNIFSNDNILEIIKSRRVIERTLLSVDTFKTKPYVFIEYYLEISGKRKSEPRLKNIHFPVGQMRSSFTYQQDSLLYQTYLQFYNKHIVAKRPDLKLSLYEVDILSPDEKFTKDFTDKIVEETNDYYLEIRTAKSKKTLNTLEARMASMKGNLNSSLSEEANSKDVNINPAFSMSQVPAQKQEVNIQVYGKAYSEMFKNMELARFAYLNELPLMQVVDPANYPMEKIQFGKWNYFILFAVFSIIAMMSVIGLIHLFSPEPTNVNPA